MNRKNVYFAMLLCMALLINGCAGMKNSTKGGLFGGGAGAAIGAGIGAIIGGGKGAAIGAAAGTAVGATAGVLIGKKMDKQQAELEAIEGAKVETITDVNNLQAIKVTFDSGILFNTGKSDLSSESKAALTDFANSLKNTTETDVTIIGHTDNTGSRAVNDRLSFERAQSVSKYITQLGIDENRTSENGVAFDQPIADNSTAEGRRQNRRVEVFITANETMIEQAENGTLK